MNKSRAGNSFRNSNTGEWKQMSFNCWLMTNVLRCLVIPHYSRSYQNTGIWDFASGSAEKPVLVGGVPVHGRGVGIEGSLGSLPMQTFLPFCDCDLPFCHLWKRQWGKECLGLPTKTCMHCPHLLFTWTHWCFNNYYIFKPSLHMSSLMSTVTILYPSFYMRLGLQCKM